MRSLIALVCGLMLLVSAAAATGNNNEITAVSTIESTGTCIVGADVVQSSTLDSRLEGCDNDVFQDMYLASDDNSLIGLMDEGNGDMAGESGENSGEAGEGEEDETGMTFIQSGKMVANATGSGANDFQDIDIIAAENCQTFGTFTQFASQTLNDIGCNDDIFQDSDINAGAIEGIEESEGNSIVNGAVTQAQVLNARATGSNNDVDQLVEQDLFDSCLTSSALVQEAVANQNVMGCENSNDLNEEEGQLILEVVDDSSFIGSSASQVVTLNEQAIGNENLVAQFGETLLDDDCVTNGAVMQSISEAFTATGCDNIADQDALLASEDNSIVGGTLSQQTVIRTNA